MFEIIMVRFKPHHQIAPTARERYSLNQGLRRYAALLEQSDTMKINRSHFEKQMDRKRAARQSIAEDYRIPEGVMG